MNQPRRLRGALFDLDGTLLDTAPDIAAAANQLLREEGRAELPFEQLRSRVSHGSAAVLRHCFADVDEARFGALHRRMLGCYRQRIATLTRPFNGFESTLRALETAGIPWGIVTNKPGWLTDALLEALQLQRRAACVLAGDSLDERKPHPRPLLVAAALMQRQPAECVYVGDARRDIDAARAAGMVPLGARFGYLGPDDEPESWQAAGWLDHPADLLAWFQLTAGDGQRV
jgi:N-acetyl-D-muramate 6-phosphate phosphatase